MADQLYISIGGTMTPKEDRPFQISMEELGCGQIWLISGALCNANSIGGLCGAIQTGGGFYFKWNPQGFAVGRFSDLFSKGTRVKLELYLSLNDSNKKALSSQKLVIPEFNLKSVSISNKLEKVEAIITNAQSKNISAK